MCLCMCVCACIDIHIYVFVYMDACIYMCLFIYVCIFICNLFGCNQHYSWDILHYITDVVKTEFPLI